ncbi:hypothetical protein ACP4OV_022833 [Aristida adscensionis]
MRSFHGSAAVIRAGRWLLPLAVPACCVLWMLALFPAQPLELAAGRRGSLLVAVGETVGAVERQAFEPPPPPPPPERGGIIATSPPPPPPERHYARTDTPPSSPPPPERNEIIDASPPPPESQSRAETSPPPPERHARRDTPAAAAAAAREERPTRSTKPKAAAAGDRCAGRYIYIQDLPRRFNADLLRRCRSLSAWTDMCRHVANAGMGPRLTRTGGVLPATGWYDTNQFTLDVIFHHRMRQYGCLTGDFSRAAAVFVPYYAGLDVGRHLWGSTNAARDALAEDLAAWLRASPAWAAHGGRDHFLVGGRVVWDFRREDGGAWGSRLLLLPEARNMTALVLESDRWHAGTDAGVPYPTYFHPARAGEVSSWQRALRRARRPWLFAFAGARRGDGSVRDRLVDQCAASRRCGLLQCGRGRRNDCYAPATVMRLLKSAAFCLQPPGDSYTRRSAFDAVLAGCVPVFFHPGSAYAQYPWHLPADAAAYSVFVPERGVLNGTVRVEDVLRRVGRARAAAMRERVLGMIPGVVYRDPRARAAGFRDAVDIAVDGVIERVRRIKRGLPPVEDGDVERRWDAYVDVR